MSPHQQGVLLEALKKIAYMRAPGDIATAKNTRALVQNMERVALVALELAEAA